MKAKPKEKILCSACLLGVNCCYNGKTRKNDKVIALGDEVELVPVCPEQLGGLPTPREPVEVRDGRAYGKSGREVTRQFEKGASAVLKIAKENNIKKAILKQRSPSCGSGQLTMLNLEVIPGDGMTTALLKKNAIEVISEEEI